MEEITFMTQTLSVLTLFIISVFSYLFSKKFKLPYTVLLVFVWILLVPISKIDFFSFVNDFELTPNILFFVFLPVANNNKPAEIILKLNSLQDRAMILKLYEASQAGVKVKLIVRGICSLIPGIKGISDNIEAISIVDRYLEHSRIFIFHNNGDEEIYLSSADWMVRNLSHRIETTFPIYDADARKEIKHFIDTQLNDNVKARILDAKQTNTYKANNSSIPVRSQMGTYFDPKREESGQQIN